MKNPGKLITFEGLDRAGKSSTVQGLLTTLKDCKAPIIACGELYSPIGSILRDLLWKGTSPFIKTFMFAADRAWTYENICLPTMQKGGIVLWDRYVDTAIVYRTVDLSRAPSEVDLEFVQEINKPFMRPDLIFYIDISEEVSETRARLIGQPEPYDKQFLREVGIEYKRLAASRGYTFVNGERPLVEVVNEIAEIIRSQFKEFF